VAALDRSPVLLLPTSTAALHAGAARLPPSLPTTAVFASSLGGVAGLASSAFGFCEREGQRGSGLERSRGGVWGGGPLPGGERGRGDTYGRRAFSSFTHTNL